jgi:hypothetical protein
MLIGRVWYLIDLIIVSKIEKKAYMNEVLTLLNTESWSQNVSSYPTAYGRSRQEMKFRPSNK